MDHAAYHCTLNPDEGGTALDTWSLPTHATCPFQTRRSHPVLPISLDPKINLPLPQTIIFEMGVAYVISAFMGGAARVRT